MTIVPRKSTAQRARILALLVNARGRWVPLPEILELHISQFGARIFELRRTGFQIENKIERDDSGVVHSWYRLLRSASAPAPPNPAETRINGVESKDWYERQAGKPRPAEPAPDFGPLFSGVQ